MDREIGSARGNACHHRAAGRSPELIRAVKNIQIIDGAENATYGIFQATDQEFAKIFPGPGQDIEIVEDFVSRVGDNEASRTLSPLWEKPIHKRHVQGNHGSLYYDYKERSKYRPRSKREVDRPSGQINEAERALYARLRAGDI
jgi:hypothetical protein